jgi:hypothetical protein
VLMPGSKQNHEARRGNSCLRKERLEAEMKANLHKRKIQARARAVVKPDAQRLVGPSRDKAGL